MAESEPKITDTEFKESADNRERMYQMELKRPPVEAYDEENRTFMDRLGRGRWPVDYYTARRRGSSHADAMLIERIAIRKAAGLPQPEQPPAPPTPPTPPPSPPPSPNLPGVKDNMERFALFYAKRCAQYNWGPNEHTSREDRIIFLQKTILEYRPLTGDNSFVMKRASPSRPISDEAVVFNVTGSGTDYRRFWDFIINGGSAAWKISVNGEGEILDMGQSLVDPVTLQIIAG